MPWNHTRSVFGFMLLLAAISACGGAADQEAASALEISGRVETGLRVLTIDQSLSRQDFRIYRGDYVRFELAAGGPFSVEIADLEVVKKYPVPDGERPYVKIPDAGSFSYRVGEVSGVITAVEFAAAGYREVSAREAHALIAELAPLVLDVRTSGEYAQGHLEQAKLIPVQEFQRRRGELAGHEHEPVLIYCRSGNRSTVAAKLLVDAGFDRIYNLRHGVKEWQREGLPLVR